MDNKFELGGRKFSLVKIDAMKQFHISRRLAPILAEVLPTLKAGTGLKSVKDVDKLTEDQKLELAAKFVGPAMSGLSKLSDEDSQFVLFSLLSGVEVQQSTQNWARVATDSMLMMQDLELPVLLNLAGRSLMYNLSGFFSVLPQ